MDVLRSEAFVGISTLGMALVEGAEYVEERTHWICVVRVAQSHLIVRFEVESPSDTPMAGCVSGKGISLQDKAKAHPNLVLEFCYHLPWATSQWIGVSEWVNIVDIRFSPI